MDEFSKTLKKDGSSFETASFNVKFNNTPENWAVYEKFKELAKKHTSNNFLLAINMLLDYYEMDWKYTSLSSSIDRLNERVSTLEVDSVKPEEKKNKPKTFGVN